jgi:thiamine biosynthesis lipoprotein
VTRSAANDVYVHSVALMDTVVTIEVVGGDDAGRAGMVARAIGWFREIETRCSRFDPASEVSALAARIGEPVPVSPMLFEVARFALALAVETDGAFDPTIGAVQAARGFDIDWRTGATIKSHSSPEYRAANSEHPSFHDVVLGPDSRTLTLARPLVLDLGAVAKGFAIDLAARELGAYRDFMIDAGGDVYAAGTNRHGEPWAVGVRHPRDAKALIDVVRVSDAAVCTSGDYERRVPGDSGGEHHILDPRTGRSPRDVASVTVIAPTAMLADGLSTAAFVLGADAGLRLLEAHGVRGIVITSSLARLTT